MDAQSALSQPSPRGAAVETSFGDLPDQAVAVRELDKVYRGQGKTPPKHALKRIDLDIPRGCLFGLLGPNGAGKSTLINILAGLVMKTGGSASIWGFDIDGDARNARSAIGIVPQELNIDPFFTPRELLDLQAGLYGVPKRERITDELLEIVGLADKAHAYARTLSGGMRRRLMVAKAMVHSPPILVLDEPTAGVDVELRQQLWAQVRALNAAGTTVLLTTHYLEEAEELCDRIAIINHGEVVICDTTQNLLSHIDSKTLLIHLAKPINRLPAALEGMCIELPESNRLVVRYRPSEQQVGTVLERIAATGLEIADLTTEQTDLEDIFLQLTSSSQSQG